eukprot:5039306-Alexandrium_andersonii.AAC.1
MRSSSLLRPCTTSRRGAECRALGAPPTGRNTLGPARRWRLRGFPLPWFPTPPPRPAGRLRAL